MSDNKDQIEINFTLAFPISNIAWVMAAGPGLTLSRELPTGFENALLSSELEDIARLENGVLELFGGGYKTVVIMEMPGFADIITIQPLETVTVLSLIKGLKKKFDPEAAQAVINKLGNLSTEAVIADGELSKVIHLIYELKVLLVSMGPLAADVDWALASKELAALTKKHFRGEDDSDDSDPWKDLMNDLKID